MKKPKRWLKTDEKLKNEPSDQGRVLVRNGKPITREGEIVLKRAAERMKRS